MIIGLFVAAAVERKRSEAFAERERRRLEEEQRRWEIEERRGLWSVAQVPTVQNGIDTALGLRSCAERRVLRVSLRRTRSWANRSCCSTTAARLACARCLLPFAAAIHVGALPSLSFRSSAGDDSSICVVFGGAVTTVTRLLSQALTSVCSTSPSL